MDSGVWRGVVAGVVDGSGGSGMGQGVVVGVEGGSGGSGMTMMLLMIF